MDKAALRTELGRRRGAVADPATEAARALDRLEALPEFAKAGRLLVYVGVRSELPTLDRIVRWIAAGRDVAVPWCNGEQLRIARLRGSDELRAGGFGIPEPSPEIREQADRRLAADEIDVFVLPGLAFDRSGGRLGYGKGHFDRLLPGARADATFVGLAFDEQITKPLPHEPHDVSMHVVVTPSELIRVRPSW